MANQGILQAQINIKNKIDLNNAFSSDTIQNPLLKSIEGNLNLKDKNSLVHFNCGNNATQHIDQIIYEDSDELDITNALNNNASVKYIKIDANIYPSVTSKFANNSNLEKIDSILPIEAGISAFENTNLKQIPNTTFNNPDQSSVLTNDSNLSPTTLDFSDKDNMTRLGVYGEESDEISNLQFVKVSTEAPFDGDSPQIKVDYTGLDKQALVSLFESMPYNVGYTEVGSPTIIDGVVSNFSANDYVRTTKPVVFSSNMSIELCIKYSNWTDGRIFRFGTDSTTAYNLRHGSNGKFRYYALDTIYTTDANIADYSYVKVITSNGLGNNVVIQVSTDGANWTNTTLTAASGTQTEPGTNLPAVFGRTIVGSIDIKETYIKVNGVTWFNGAATRQLNSAATNVGGVTITNGIASGFSNSKYIYLANGSTSSSVEAFMFFTTSNVNTSQRIFGHGNYWGVHITQAGKLKGNIYLTPSADKEITLDTSLTSNTKYAFKWEAANNVFSFSLYSSNGTLIETQTANFTGNISGEYFCFGRNSLNNTDSFEGSIDLNSVYIKKDGSVFFHGTSPMTKTCSIIGCTGTVDLTADDKAIATNKGWTLVTSES